MLVKSFVAGLVSMATAAGVVWFNTEPADAEHPHKTPRPTKQMDKTLDEAPETQSSVEMSSERTVDEKPKPRARKQTLSSKPEKTASDERKARWIDQYIKDKQDGSQDADTAEVVIDDTGMAKDDAIRESGGKFNIDKLDRQSEASKSQEPRRVEKKMIKKRVMISDEPKTMEELDLDALLSDMDDDSLSWFAEDGSIVERNITMGENGERIETVVISKDGNVEIDRKVLKELPGRLMIKSDDAAMMKPEGMKVFAKAQPDELLETAETISDTNLRDQALYAIALYALRHDDFDAADEAMGDIDQIDLRETARSKIAIRYAETGDIDTAQDVINQIADEDLRDLIRVQMIETLTMSLEKRQEY